MHILKLQLHFNGIKKYFKLLTQLFFTAPSNFRYGFAILLLGFFIGVTGFLRNLLVLSVSDVFTFNIWKIVTSSFVEPNFFVFVWSLISLFQFCTIIESVWGLIEVAKYICIVQLITTGSIAVLALLCFVFFQSLYLLYFVPLCGFSVFAISALVALKQFLPDTVVLTTPYGRLKNGHLPITVLFASIVCCLFSLLRGGVPLQIAFGLQISWVYLRFFRVAKTFDLNEDKTTPSIAVVGDDTEHFTWASFFPRRTQWIANAISNVTFRLLISLRVCKQLKALDFNKLETLIQSNLQTFENRDADRKRQKALRMLNERLTSVVSSGSSYRGTIPSSQELVNSVGKMSLPSFEPSSFSNVSTQSFNLYESTQGIQSSSYSEAQETNDQEKPLLLDKSFIKSAVEKH